MRNFKIFLSSSVRAVASKIINRFVRWGRFYFNSDKYDTGNYLALMYQKILTVCKKWNISVRSFEVVDACRIKCWKIYWGYARKINGSPARRGYYVKELVKGIHNRLKFVNCGQAISKRQNREYIPAKPRIDVRSIDTKYQYNIGIT